MAGSPYAIPSAPGPEWWTDALCRVEQGEDFFPDERGRHSQAPRASEAAAKAVCARCPVREPCLHSALANREPIGIWGGLTTAERQRLLTDDPRRVSAS